MSAIVYINGDYVAKEEAKISVFDRAFLFGDAIYEVIPVYNGHCFYLDAHINRLHSNLNKVNIPLPHLDWHAIGQELIRRNGGGDLQLYIQVTRGDYGYRKHDYPTEIIPNIVAFTIHNHFPSLQEANDGLHAIIFEDYRWQRCDIKTTSLIANVMLNDEARRHGANTTILSRQGYLTEGSTHNVFLVNDLGDIRTPPLNELCLPGITRQILTDIIFSLGWTLIEEPIPVQDLFTSQEIWITSTTKEVFPVTMLNHQRIGNGKTGPKWHIIKNKYKELVATHE